jgi:hypothetical protein
MLRVVDSQQQQVNSTAEPVEAPPNITEDGYGNKNPTVGH